MHHVRSILLAALVLGAIIAAGCGSSSSPGSAAVTSTTSPAPAATTAPATFQPETTVPATSAPNVATTTAATANFDATPADFRNLNDMTPVRGFFVDNLLGDLDATVAAAENVDGAVWPVGSLVQLVPTEAMIKRAPGFSPATNDWEFFELTVDETGSSINVRGGAEVENFIGLSCADCHAKAEPQFDFICEQDHGCDPLPFDAAFFQNLQATDPRPRAE
ncbi:MAG: hypothetical protein HKN26_12630 [Acidimicrobiales bacterium]|nr:hypothetical protein [Acidimicrobiales bacterium]